MCWIYCFFYCTPDNWETSLNIKVFDTNYSQSFKLKFSVLRFCVISSPRNHFESEIFEENFQRFKVEIVDMFRLLYDSKSGNSMEILHSVWFLLQYCTNSGSKNFRWNFQKDRLYCSVLGIRSKEESLFLEQHSRSNLENSILLRVRETPQLNVTFVTFVSS